MKLVYIGVNNLMGRCCGITLKSPNLLLGGEMGSGKSTVINAVNFGLGLPTRFGSTGLDALSPTGSWSVVLEFENGRVKRLERGLAKGKSNWQVNGMKADEEEFLAAAREILDVEPHHVSLNAFLSLSDQKRAGVFARMLEKAATFDVKTIVQAGEKCTLDEFVAKQIAQEYLNRAQDLLSKIKMMAGTPAELADGLKAVVNEAVSKERDAKVRLEGLMQRQASMTHGMTPAEIKNKIQSIDEQLGGLKARKDNLVGERDRYAQAQKLVKQTETQLETARKKLNDETLSAQKAPGIIQLLDALEKQQRDLQVSSDDLESQVETAGKALAALESESSRLSHAHALISDVLSQPWKLDHEWLVEEWLQFISDVEITDTKGLTAEKQERLMRFAKEIVTEALGGDLPTIKGKIEALTGKIAAQAAVVDAGRASLKAIDIKIAACSKAIDEQQKALNKAEESKEKLPELADEVKRLDTARMEMAQSAQRTGASEDEAALDGQLGQLGEQRDTLAAQHRELEENQAISGQVEEQRVEVACTSLIAEFVRKLADLAQRWRDGMVRDQLGNVMEPFRKAFGTIFGADQSIQHHSRGEGRKTEFYFTINRRGIAVPFDLLSDGEMILTAAAFLTALQKIKQGPGSFLSLNSGELSLGGLRQLLTASPQLGLDCLIVANNNAAALMNTGFKLDGWDYVSMDSPPPLRR